MMLRSYYQILFFQLMKNLFQLFCMMIQQSILYTTILNNQRYMSKSRIVMTPPAVSQQSQRQYEDQYADLQLRLAIDDQFHFSDLKSFSQSSIYEFYQQENKKYIKIAESNQQCFDLYTLYFFVNSQGKRKYLQKFKKVGFYQPIIIPNNANENVIQLNNDFVNFFPIVIAKLKHYETSFYTIEQTIKFFHDYELFLHIAKIVFFTFLKSKYKDCTIDKFDDIDQNQFNVLNQHFHFEEENMILKFDFANKRLEVLENQSENLSIQDIRRVQIIKQVPKLEVIIKQHQDAKAQKVDSQIDHYTKQITQSKNLHQDTKVSQIDSQIDHYPKQITQSKNLHQDTKVSQIDSHINHYPKSQKIVKNQKQQSRKNSESKNSKIFQIQQEMNHQTNKQQKQSEKQSKCCYFF